MTREETQDVERKVVGFNHGMDSRGNILTPWRHELDCVMCNRLTDFIMAILVKHQCQGHNEYELKA